MQLITKLLRRASQFDCSGDATVSAFKERPSKEAQPQCDCASIELLGREHCTNSSSCRELPLCRLQNLPATAGKPFSQYRDCLAACSKLLLYKERLSIPRC